MSDQLTWWERHNEYQATIQVREDIHNIPAAIERVAQTNEIVMNRRIAELVQTGESQTARLLASQDRIRDGLGHVHGELRDVSSGIAGLRSSFEWGFSCVVWQLEREREDLKAILDTLQSPLKTGSDERKLWGDQQFIKCNYTEALQEYRAAIEIYPYDFSVYISIAHILAFHKDDSEGALDAFEKAVHQKPPTSVLCGIYLHESYLLRKLHRIEDALVYTSKLVSMDSVESLSMYEHAKNLALLGRGEEMSPYLQQAIELDIGFWKRLEGDPAFDSVKPQVISLCSQLLIGQQHQATELADYIDKHLAHARIQAMCVADWLDASKEIETIAHGVEEARLLMARESYLDTLIAKQRLIGIRSNSARLSEIIRGKMVGQINNRRADIEKMEIRLKSFPAELRIIENKQSGFTGPWGCPLMIMTAIIDSILSWIGIRFLWTQLSISGGLKFLLTVVPPAIIFGISYLCWAFVTDKETSRQQRLAIESIEGIELFEAKTKDSADLIRMEKMLAAANEALVKYDACCRAMIP